MTSRPLVLMRGPERRPFISNWVRAAGEVADTSQLVRDPQAAGTNGYVAFPSPPARKLQRYSNVFTGPVCRRLDRAVVDHLGQRPDLLHSHFYSDAHLLAAYARRYRIPLVHTEHSSSLLPPRTASRRGLEQLRIIYDTAAVVIAVSDDMAGAIRDLVPAACPVVIPNPVHVGSVLDRPARGDPPTIVMVGGLSEPKRPLLALEAFVELVQHDPEVRLRFVGDGPQRTAIEDQARSAGVSDRVEVTGFLAHDRSLDAIASAAVLLHCSPAETFGVVLVEAALLSRPVVSTDCGGVADELAGKTGFWAAASDAQSVAAALDDALGEPDARELTDFAHSRYSVEVVGRQLGDIYTQVLGGR